MPVLDGNMDADGLSDARSLAASMRGGVDKTSKNNANSNVDEDREVESVFSTSSTSDSLSVSSVDSTVATLCNNDALVAVVKGGGGDDDDDDGKASPQRKMTTSDFTQTPNMGFQPIPGLISPTPMMGGMMSPPPMLMPTPIPGGQLSMLGAGGYPSLTSPLMLGGQGMNASTASEIQPAMAFTYVPIPVYNMGGMGMGMTPNLGVMSPNVTGETNRTQPQGTSTPLAAGAAGQAGNDAMQNMSAAQLSYQQAFLQNAVAQNMQIQQQLMMQNQALSQLLSQSGNVVSGGSGNNSWGSGPNSSMTTMMGTPMASVMPAAMSTPMNMNMAMNLNAQQQQQQQQHHLLQQQQQQQQQQLLQNQHLLTEAHRRASVDNLDEVKADKEMVEMKQRSMSTPNTPKQSGLQLPPQAPMMPPGNSPSDNCGIILQARK